MNLVTRTAFSCKDCTKRYVGCHSTCKEYNEEKSRYDNEAEGIKKTKQQDRDVIISTYKTKRMPIPDRTK